MISKIGERVSKRQNFNQHVFVETLKNIIVGEMQGQMLRQFADKRLEQHQQDVAAGQSDFFGAHHQWLVDQVVLMNRMAGSHYAGPILPINSMHHMPVPLVMPILAQAHRQQHHVESEIDRHGAAMEHAITDLVNQALLGEVIPKSKLERTAFTDLFSQLHDAYAPNVPNNLFQGMLAQGLDAPAETFEKGWYTAHERYGLHQLKGDLETLTWRKLISMSAGQSDDPYYWLTPTDKQLLSLNEDVSEASSLMQGDDGSLLVYLHLTDMLLHQSNELQAAVGDEYDWVLSQWAAASRKHSIGIPQAVLDHLSPEGYANPFHSMTRLYGEQLETFHQARETLLSIMQDIVHLTGFSPTTEEAKYEMEKRLRKLHDREIEEGKEAVSALSACSQEISLDYCVKQMRRMIAEPKYHPQLLDDFEEMVTAHTVLYHQEIGDYLTHVRTLYFDQKGYFRFPEVHFNNMHNPDSLIYEQCKKQLNHMTGLWNSLSGSHPKIMVTPRLSHTYYPILIAYTIDEAITRGHTDLAESLFDQLSQSQPDQRLILNFQDVMKEFVRDDKRLDQQTLFNLIAESFIDKEYPFNGFKKDPPGVENFFKGISLKFAESRRILGLLFESMPIDLVENKAAVSQQIDRPVDHARMVAPVSKYDQDACQLSKSIAPWINNGFVDRLFEHFKLDESHLAHMVASTAKIDNRMVRQRRQESPQVIADWSERLRLLYQPDDAWLFETAKSPHTVWAITSSLTSRSSQLGKKAYLDGLIDWVNLAAQELNDKDLYGRIIASLALPLRRGELDLCNPRVLKRVFNAFPDYPMEDVLMNTRVYEAQQYKISLFDYLNKRPTNGMKRVLGEAVERLMERQRSDIAQQPDQARDGRGFDTDLNMDDIL